ncbi:MAG: hypothetical protein E6H88_16130 [Chloroflexi bacterium]|nr:MAG: hypothetical protein E6I20_13760 [Chloroflexota bacterium]TMG34004.1 MAG: hypothetical protein E6H88_16130 [Chloroflexota bacterium]
MPIPTQFPEGTYSTFWGDYAGLDATNNAISFWSDTRDPDLFACPASGGGIALPPAVCGGSSGGTTLNDQNVYVANVAVPSK